MVGSVKRRFSDFVCVMAKIAMDDGKSLDFKAFHGRPI